MISGRSASASHPASVLSASRSAAGPAGRPWRCDGGTPSTLIRSSSSSRGSVR